MSDLTLLLASANILPSDVARRLREYVLDVTGGRYPVVSVSHQPLDFGRNICVGEWPVNKYSFYKQLYIGVNAVTTPYVATIDDDTLYAPEHFEHRPPPHVFYYETNYWFLQLERDYYWRIADHRTKGGGMWGCIAETETMRANLHARFCHFRSNPLSDDTRLMFGEPGVSDGDRLYGVKTDSVLRGYSAQPCAIFIHPLSMGYNQFRKFHRRYGYPSADHKRDRLEQFGTPAEAKERFWN